MSPQPKILVIWIKQSIFSCMDILLNKDSVKRVKASLNPGRFIYFLKISGSWGITSLFSKEDIKEGVLSESLPKVPSISKSFTFS